MIDLLLALFVNSIFTPSMSNPPGLGKRVLRGGSWGDETRDYTLRNYALSSYRAYDPGFRRGRVGFRTVVELGSARSSNGTKVTLRISGSADQT